MRPHDTSITTLWRTGDPVTVFKQAADGGYRFQVRCHFSTSTDQCEIEAQIQFAECCSKLRLSQPAI